MIPAIPVWSIRPNWREGIRETLSWLTDVLDSTNGTEQRVSLRLSPRRSFEMLFNPIDDARSYFDLFLHRMASIEFFLPLFHDKAKLDDLRTVGDTDIPFDNTYREFETGGYAILLGDSPFEYEVIEITAQDASGLTVAPLVGEWRKGTTLHPLRIARLADETALSALTSHVGQSTLLFTLVRANDFAEGVWSGVSYEDRPVLTVAPNRREPLDVNFLRKAVTVDNDLGIPYLADEANRAFQTQIHSWLIRGRQEHAEFRSMWYRLRGRSQAIWLPSFNDDVIVARDADMADTTLDIKKIGYQYTGGAITGRNHLYFRREEMAMKIVDVGVPLSLDEERLELEEVIGVDIPAGRKGCFLEAARLDQDEVEILHYTDTSGTSECQVAFRSYQDERIEDEAVGGPVWGGEDAGKHAWWRVFVTDNAISDDDTFISYIEFRDNRNVPKPAIGGTAISGGAGIDLYTPDRAFIGGGGGTYYGRNVPGGFYVGYHYPAKVGCVQVLLQGDALWQRSPRTGTIDYSDDGINWISKFNFNFPAWISLQEHLIPDPLDEIPTGAHYAWRVFCVDNHGDAAYIEIGDLEFRQTVGGPDETSPSAWPWGDADHGRPIASDSIDFPHRAFGGDGAGASWASDGNNNAWIGFLFGVPKKIVEIELTATMSPARAAYHMMMQYSDDLITWTTTKTFEDPAPTAGQVTVFDVEEEL